MSRTSTTSGRKVRQGHPVHPAIPDRQDHREIKVRQAIRDLLVRPGTRGRPALLARLVPLAPRVLRERLGLQATRDRLATLAPRVPRDRKAPPGRIPPFPARKAPPEIRVLLDPKAHRAIRDRLGQPGPMEVKVRKVQRDRKGHRAT